MLDFSKKTEIHYWGHASYSIIKDNCHLLIDPILNEPFESGDTFFNPPRVLDLDKIPKVDAVYISHNHTDHFDESTLKYFLKYNPQFFCPDDPEITNSLSNWRANKIKIIQAKNPVSFGPYTLYPTASMSFSKELGLVVKTSDITIWNQVDTSVDLMTIWDVHNKFKEIDILFCPFQPIKEYSVFWPKEISFPKKRLDNLINKSLAVRAKYIIPSSCSIKLGNYLEWANTRVFPISKNDFIQQIKKHPLSAKTHEMETGEKLYIKKGELNTGSSYFIKKTGKSIDFSNFQSHPTPFPLNSKPSSEKAISEIVTHLKKLPSFLSKLMNKNFNYYLEYIKLNNYRVVIEIVNKSNSLFFTLDEHLQKLHQVSSVNDWDYWFQYGAADLEKKIKFPDEFLSFYAYRNTSSSHNKKLESPLALYGYNEEITVDGYSYDNFLYFFPFLSE